MSQKKFSRLLREARNSSALTLRDLAKRAGTSHSTIAAYEQGRKTPSADVFLRLINACGVDLAPIRTSRIASLDLEARGQELKAVLDLAEQFPARHKANPNYPVFPR